MRTNSPLAFLFLLTCIVLLNQSCDETPLNEPPECVINSPAKGDTIELYSHYTIEVDAFDSDGFIESIMIYINEIGYRFTEQLPARIRLYADNPGIDSLRILAMAVDNEGLIARDTSVIHFAHGLSHQGLPIKDISGVISEDIVFSRDTVWHIVGHCLLEKGATLLIESGTLVSFAPNLAVDYDAYCINVQGRFIARGTPEQKITFKSDNLGDEYWGGIIFHPESEDWGIDSSGSIVEYCEFFNGAKSTSYGMITPITLDNSSPMIRRNSFYNSIGFDLRSRDAQSMNSKALIYDNYFTGYIRFNSDFDFIGNTLDGGMLSIKDGCSAIIERNQFKNTREMGAIRLYENSSSIKILKNSFTNNERCVELRWVTSQGVIMFNNFENSDYGIFMDETTIDISVTENYWGTDDSLKIGSIIYDFHDDYSLGKVDYSDYSMIRYQ